MDTFRVQDEDGATYDIEAPDVQSAVAAFNKMKASKFANRKGSFLPLRTDEKDNLKFDPTTGILGSILSGATAPGDVAMGRLDPNSPEAMRRAFDFTAIASPVSAATRAASTVVPGTLKTLTRGQPKVPTAQELKAASSAGFDQARNLGVDYSAEAVKSMGDDIARSLEADGFFAELAPKTHSILSRLKEPPEGSVSSLDNLVTLRKTLQEAGGSSDPTERAAASRAINALDDFIAQADPSSVVAGPAPAASALLQDARGNYAAAMRSGRVTGAEDAAERSAAAAGSGLNIDNRRRQLLNSILNKPKERRGYSQEELALIEEIVRGKFGTNAARWLGNFLGGGGGLGAQGPAAVGGALGSLVGGWPGAAIGAAIPPAIGAALRAAAGKSTERQISRLDELIRKRSPLYQKATENPPVLEGIHPEIRALLTRALMAQQLAQER